MKNLIAALQFVSARIHLCALLKLISTGQIFFRLRSRCHARNVIYFSQPLTQTSFLSLAESKLPLLSTRIEDVARAGDEAVTRAISNKQRGCGGSASQA